MNVKSAFTLIEVIISLLIISITFLTFSELIKQNINVSEKITKLSNDSQQQLNLLSIYTIEPNVTESEVNYLFPKTQIDIENKGTIGIYQELEVSVKMNNQQLSFIILR